jgi:hypothetical protein
MNSRNVRIARTIRGGLGDQTPSRPVPAPRLAPTRPAPLKSNFLAGRDFLNHPFIPVVHVFIFLHQFITFNNEFVRPPHAPSPLHV